MTGAIFGRFGHSVTTAQVTHERRMKIRDICKHDDDTENVSKRL